MNEKYDVIIVGGAMVGGTLACALADSPLRVAVIECADLPPFDSCSEHDLRVSALSIASERILKHIGVWQGIEQRRLCPYRRMKVWEQSEVSASTLFTSDDIGYDHLGYIVENRIVQLAINDQIKQLSNVDLISPVEIAQIDYSAGSTLIELADGRQLIAKLMVAADGGESRVRDAVGVGVHRWDYEQHALVASVMTECEQQDITWQQFTPTGPLAYLPLSGKRGSLVWYDTPATIKHVKGLSEDKFLEAVHERFPECLGRIEQCLSKGSFPLRRQHALSYQKEGVVLVGDAAHMIHPLAGQGVNIGLLDAAVLAEVLMEAVVNQGGPKFWSSDVLAIYEKRRRKHNLAIMQTMDVFYRVFSNDVLPLKLVRNLGLGLAGKFAPARNKVMSFAMGLEGDLPKIAQ